MATIEDYGKKRFCISFMVPWAFYELQKIGKDTDVQKLASMLWLLS